MMVLILAACDTDTPQKSDKAEAGEVAISCIAQLNTCEDWAPIKMGDGAVPVPMEDCSKIGEHEYGEEAACRRRNENREERNWEIQSRPSSRSPCQQKIDSCVRMVEALVGQGPDQVHNHYK